jgi:PadR family transcriptional regulator, regulatory protein PadR
VFAWIGAVFAVLLHPNDEAPRSWTGEYQLYRVKPMAALRMTVGVLAVLGALLDRPDTELYGLEIVRASGLEPGTIYPILQRLRGAGWVSDRWEDPEPAHIEGRPPRRYYRLTVEGRARAVHALRNGRDRSGLSALLAPPRFAATPTTEAGPG